MRENKLLNNFIARKIEFPIHDVIFVNSFVGFGLIIFIMRHVQKSRIRNDFSCIWFVLSYCLILWHEIAPHLTKKGCEQGRLNSLFVQKLRNKLEQPLILYYGSLVLSQIWNSWKSRLVPQTHLDWIWVHLSFIFLSLLITMLCVYKWNLLLEKPFQIMWNNN